MNVYARTGLSSWSRVLSHDEDGCALYGPHFSFEEIWSNGSVAPAATESAIQRKAWSELLCPLPFLEIPCWAYAMSYPSHQKEVRISETFRFRKFGPACGMEKHIEFRDHLDYEAEIGLLMHHSNTDRFGYFMLNDLTDRGIQVLGHSRNKEKRLDSYSKAKSFTGALAVGPLIAIGGEGDWPQIEISLRLNGELRQTVRAIDCVLSPKLIHKELYTVTGEHTWLMSATGTAEGIILNVPSLREKMGLLMRSGLSARRARATHLKRHTFLRPGDKLEIASATLGYNVSVITASTTEPHVRPASPL